MQTRKLFRKNVKIKGDLILGLKLFRSQVRRKHSTDREFSSLAVRGKEVLT